jgi:hypothetical protein
VMIDGSHKKGTLNCFFYLFSFRISSFRSIEDLLISNRPKAVFFFWFRAFVLPGCGRNSLDWI